MALEATEQPPLSVHRARVASNPLVRWAWGAGGTLSLGMGLVGVVVPGWPTTIFLIIAAVCYARSSQRMYDRIISNRAFGGHVRRFREDGVMPRRAKALALGIMWPFVLFAVLIAIPSPVLWARIATLALALVGTAYILWLPSAREAVPVASQAASDGRSVEA
jgi:hypothetical protein